MNNDTYIAHNHSDDFSPAVAESNADYIARAHIPMRFRECTLESWEPQNDPLRRTVEDYCRDWPTSTPFMLLMGNRGRGKTHLACGALRRMYELHSYKKNPPRGRFWPFIELLDRYKATFDEDRATESVEAIDAEMRRTPVLVLDDVGANKVSEFAEERLFRLVDERYRDRRPLIVTTNLTLTELPSRMASRLADGLVLQFKGPDRRMQ